MSASDSANCYNGAIIVWCAVYPNIVCLFQNQLIVMMALHSCVMCSVSQHRMSVSDSANCNNGAAFLCGVHCIPASYVCFRIC